MASFYHENCNFILQLKNESNTLDVLDSILESITEGSDIAFKNKGVMNSLPGFKIKNGSSSVLLQQLERANGNTTNVSPGSKSIKNQDKGIAEILMLQQRTVLQVN